MHLLKTKNMTKYRKDRTEQSKQKILMSLQFRQDHRIEKTCKEFNWKLLVYLVSIPQTRAFKNEDEAAKHSLRG